MTAPAPVLAPGATEPIDEFSNGHENILHQLTALETLPGLLKAAADARRIAEQSLAFFDDVIRAHHSEEEQSLFPAVLASATPGEERLTVQDLADRLSQEHRSVEAAWERLKPHLKDAAKGHPTGLDLLALAHLVATYKAHAGFEEAQFLPLARTILGRNGNHVAALGLTMHMRRALPGVMERFGHRI
jgi:hemerythrin-like domain-containing protein